MYRYLNFCDILDLLLLDPGEGDTPRKVVEGGQGEHLGQAVASEVLDLILGVTVTIGSLSVSNTSVDITTNKTSTQTLCRLTAQ